MEQQTKVWFQVIVDGTAKLAEWVADYRCCSQEGKPTSATTEKSGDAKPLHSCSFLEQRVSEPLARPPLNCRQALQNRLPLLPVKLPHERSQLQDE